MKDIRFQIKARSDFEYRDRSRQTFYTWSGMPYEQDDFDILMVVHAKRNAKNECTKLVSIFTEQIEQLNLREGKIKVNDMKLMFGKSYTCSLPYALYQ